MDKYLNFAALSAAEKEGFDFEVHIVRKPSQVVVIAPHGGGIEPGTSEIARTIAGDDLALAEFSGVKEKGNGDLHITSTNFDEPRCVDAVQSSDIALAIHGESSDEEVVYLGGKDAVTGGRVRASLIDAGFRVERHVEANLQGTHDSNICNRCKSGSGVQLELAKGLRKTFFRSFSKEGRAKPTSALVKFANAVRLGLGLGALPTEDDQLYFRAGARAEYLAQFVLSKFGAAVSIPRQEDHGFDVYCSIDTATTGELSDFRHAYYVQLKHGTPKSISFGGATSGGKWRNGEIHWLLNLDIPLMLGFVDIERQKIKLFQTSSRWLLYYGSINSQPPFQVSLEPSESVSAPTAKDSQSEAAPTTNGHDGKHWHVSLGRPLLEIEVSDLLDAAKVSRIKTAIAEYVKVERVNIAHRELRTQYATWISAIDWDQQPFQQAWVVETKDFPTNSLIDFNRECGRYLAMLIFRLEAANDQSGLKHACALFRQMESSFNLPANLRKLLEPILSKF